MTFQGFRATANSAEMPESVTFLVYYSGDNNLSQFMENSLQQLIKEGAGKRVHVAVQFDGQKKNDSVRLAVVENDGQSNVQIYQKNIEYNMGDPQTLIDFVQWGSQKFSSSKLVLLVFAHGRGVLNVPVQDGSSFSDSSQITKLASSSDDTSKSYMNEEELVIGLKKVLDPRRVDLVIYNSCLMGNFEILNIFSKVSDYMIASEYPIYLSLKESEDLVGRSIPIHRVLHHLKQQKKFDVLKMSQKILKDFDETYQDFVFSGSDPDVPTLITYPSTLALYDLNKVKDLTQTFQKGIDYYLKKTQNDARVAFRFYESILQSDYVDSLGYIDLSIFFSNLMQSISDSHSKDLELELKSRLSSVVVDAVSLHPTSQNSISQISYFFPSVTKERKYVQKFLGFYEKINEAQKMKAAGFLRHFWQRLNLESSDFWIHLVERWAAGEDIFADYSLRLETADYFFFLHLDVQALSWASESSKKINEYANYLQTVLRTSPEFEDHKQFVEGLALRKEQKNEKDSFQ